MPNTIIQGTIENPLYDANGEKLIILLPSSGGTGVANNAASTFTINGAFPVSITVTGPTDLTFPAGPAVSLLPQYATSLMLMGG
jgi:hypothetical protein